MKIFFCSLIAMLFSCGVSAGGVEPVPSSLVNHVHLELGFGTPLIKAQTLSTPIAQDSLVIDTERSMAVQFLAGYQWRWYAGLMTGMSYFPSARYDILPSHDSMSRKLYAYDILARVVMPLKRFRLYFSGGGALVYANAANFDMPVPDSIPTPSSRPGYLDGRWGRASYFRPELRVGFGLALTPKLSAVITYTRIFGCGHFSSQLKWSSGSYPVFVIDKGYLQTINVLSLVLDITL